MKDRELENFIKKGFEQMAADLEAELPEESPEPKMSKEKESALFAELERREAERAAKKSKKTKVHPISRMRLAVLAAATMLLMAMGISSMGDRLWRSESLPVERESEVSVKVNNEEKSPVLKEEEEVYREIQETLGIQPLQFGYLPHKMEFDQFRIMQGTGVATAFYQREEQVMRVTMSKHIIENSTNLQADGTAEVLRDFSCSYDAEVYCITDIETEYLINLEYGNGYYSIWTNLPKEEVFLILENIFFKNV